MLQPKNSYCTPASLHTLPIMHPQCGGFRIAAPRADASACVAMGFPGFHRGGPQHGTIPCWLVRRARILEAQLSADWCLVPAFAILSGAAYTLKRRGRCVGGISADLTGRRARRAGSTTNPAPARWRD